MKRTGVVVCLLLLLAVPLLAQVNTADIVGRVLDPNGLIVPGAKVTVQSEATGQTRETTTNDSGEFVVALLPAGNYKVTVEKSGFSTKIYEKLVLAVGSKQDLEVSLALGAGRDVITVTAEAPLIEQNNSEIRASLTPLEVQELPILNRNFSDLTHIIPGVRPSHAFDPTKTRVGNMSANGSDGRAFDVNVDGGDNKDNVVGGLVQNYTIEGIQEFNVITNRYTAESGRAVAAVVNVVTKSGTNEAHGSLFSLFQSSTFNKIRFFDKIAGRPKPVFHKYQFGGSVGAPIIKDRLFAFGAYEHRREPGRIGVSPTAFSELSLFPLANPVTQIDSPYYDHLLTVKVDQIVSNRQTLSYRYGRQRWVNPNDQLGDPFVADLTQTQTNKNQFHDFTAQHTYTIGMNKVNAFTFHYQYFLNQIFPAPVETFTLGTATNPNIIFPGGAQIGQNVNVPQETGIKKYQFRDDFSWTKGSHGMKFGVNYIYSKLSGFFFFGANGYQIFFFDNPSFITSNPSTCGPVGNLTLPCYPQGFATPGAVRQIDFNGGTGDHPQNFHQIALYFQDDYKITSRLTLNLGLRWDANPNFLVKQLTNDPLTTNRTIAIFRQVVAANPTAAAAQDGLNFLRGIVGDEEKLRRTTANWREFQPRVGFAWDALGSGKLVVRGGYGIAFDQVFQNLTLFSQQQTHPELYQTLITLANTAGPRTPGGPVGQLATFRFGVDPLPPAPSAGPDPRCPAQPIIPTDLACGAFGRINDPRIRDPYVQQTSIGAAWQINPDYAFSLDFYHVLGIAESRVQNINPLILPVCGNPVVWPGANPLDPRCVRGGSTRFLDAVFAAVPSVGANRLTQSNMIGTTNRSQFNGLNFVLKKRYSQKVTMQASYVLSWSRSFGGRPTASYSGNGIAITPNLQFRPGEFGPTLVDERHRFVLSGVFGLPWGFEASPIFQASSARPFNFRSGVDTDGDGRNTVDRVCTGSTILSPRIPGVAGVPFLCEQVPVNSLRGDPYVQLDTRFGWSHPFTERMKIRLYYEIFNLFNTNNFGNCFETNANLGQVAFNRPVGYFGCAGGDRTAGQGFGKPITESLRSQFGFRFEF